MNLNARSICFAFYSVLLTLNTSGQVVGRMDTLYIKDIAGLQDRTVYVWKPTNYTSSIKYNVLYMHDGQMLFDAATTWNHQEWRVDEILDSLITDNIIQPCIVVGICNVNGYRYADYFPQDVFESIPVHVQEGLLEKQNIDALCGNVYADWIATQLAPKINLIYSTHNTANHQCIAGSSMGGLASWYIALRHSKLFGNAMCFSTHWPGGDPTSLGDTVFNAFRAYIEKSDAVTTLRNSNGKFYFDCGDKTLDKYYPAMQRQIDKVFYNKQFDLTQYWAVYDSDAAHDELAWSKRFGLAMMYIWPKQ
jgi:esterase/lipase superfamily enzyme